MDKNNSKTKPADTTQEANEADNVDKIRDILFGNQMRDVDKRFASLEKSLANDLAALRKENALQLDSLKTFIESEIGILGSRLSAEENARIENIDDLEGQLKQQVRQIDKRIGDVSKAMDKNTSDTNQKILKQSQDFSKELNDQISDARERMDDHHQDLSGSKVGKNMLSELFNSLALQVNPDDTDKK
jgi:DNA anti-recombination protein RmuC